MPNLDDFANAGLPVPAIYAQESSAADKAYQDALAAIAQQQSLLSQKYGFKTQVDPTTGALQGTQIDPSNEFSNVMTTLTSNSRQLRNLRELLSGQGLAGGGLKGLAAQRAALLKYQQQGQVAGLGSRFAEAYGGLENQRAGARSSRDQGYNQAATDAINFAIANGWFNQAAPSLQPAINTTLQSADPGGSYNQPSPQDMAPVGDSGAINPISNVPLVDAATLASNYTKQAPLPTTDYSNPFANIMGKPVSGYSSMSRSSLH